MLLNKLRTSDAVAKFLRQAGCLGVQMDSRTCPVAQYMRRCYPQAKNISVGLRFSHINLRSGLLVIRHSDAVKLFVESFDSGYYHDLISKRNDADQR
ncbi:hypothetical protein [Nonomuraea sp. SYSU D8015]|uniref:hypothetical protein n=1 Tax=Nonomuraea sp. SYSU D8015 TaxID=2593644 RepID=UPI00166027E9|nr:hypothetical protein [Nonomuraea sp. SYSU D8015]